MADQLLISFCNFESDRPSGWLWVQTEPFSATWVIPAGLPMISSCTGLTVGDGKIFCTGHRKQTGFIAVLDEETWELLIYHELSDLVDPHSIIRCDGQLHVVNTGRDQVCQLDWTSEAPKLKPIWTLGKGESDEHHLNGLCMHQGNLVCSGFGPKPDAGWKSAHEGRIFDITNQTELVSKLHHPHSVTPDFEGNLIWCESRESRVQSQYGSSFESIEGYVRGLCLASQNRIWVATSRHRTKSKSTGLHVEASIEKSSTRCGIYSLDPTQSEPTAFIDLSNFGDEIYDIIRLSAPPGDSVKTNWEIRHHKHVRSLETKCEQERSWGRDLQNELQRARDEIQRIHTAFDEQLIGAHSLQKELGFTQKEFYRVTKLSDERTAWTISLKQELERTKSEFEKASKLALERTKWAQDSLIEIDRGRIVIEQLKKQLENQSGSLDEAVTTSAQFRNKLADVLTLVESNPEQRRFGDDILAPKIFDDLNAGELLNRTAVVVTQLQRNYACLTQQLRDATDEISLLEQHRELTNSQIDWLHGQLSRILTARQRFNPDKGSTD